MSMIELDKQLDDELTLTAIITRVRELLVYWKQMHERRGE